MAKIMTKIDKVDILPGESMELMIPKNLIDNAKRKGLMTARLRMKYKDMEGNDYKQVFEIDLETMNIKEIKEEE